MKLPTLYKLSSKGARTPPQQWEISVDDSTIITRWGQVGGAIQETRDVITTGKNIGKKNETTPAQQALAEAQSQWEKKLKKGYVKTLDDAVAGKVDSVIEGGVSPMLAHRFDQYGHKLKYPCLVQPKLDGHRCIAVVESDGSVTLWTRTRKRITSMVHIQKAITDLGLPPGAVLDGELYHHDYKDRFQDLASFIMDSSVKPGAEVVQYHVYDLVKDGPQNLRSHELKAIINHPSLVCVETRPASDDDELDEWFREYLRQGYEGAVARNADGKYVNKRSYDLLKIKEFQDEEFEVIGVKEGRGKLAGHAIFVCKIGDNSFKAKMMGELSNLKQYWEDPSLAIGRKLTVKYFGFTKDGVPRFPVALRFRDE